MSLNVVVLLDNHQGREIVEESCKANGLLFDAFQELVKAEFERTGKRRAPSLRDSFDDILDRIQADEQADVY